MAKFLITPHFRLHEWVAEEKGYFRAEGLDYEFREVFKTHATPDKVGAMTSFEKGRETNVSCACHWTVNVAASQGLGKMYADAYSVSPERRVRAAESPIREPTDLKGVPISVGHQSGSHYSTLQALEQYLPREDIKLSFADGILFGRMEKLIDRQVPAAALFSGPYYFAEQLGFRKVIDTTFMIASMLTGDPTPRTCASISARYAARSATSTCGPSSTPTTTPRNSRAASSARSTRGAGGRASASCSSPTRARCSKQSFKWIAEREIFEPGEDGRRALRRGLRFTLTEEMADPIF